MIIKGYYNKLEGSHYEIGKQIGKVIRSKSELLKQYISEENCLENTVLEEVISLLDQYCPNINEEIQGFCDELKIQKGQVKYYQESYMYTGCSHGMIPYTRTKDKCTYVYRNYDFTHLADDMRLCSVHSHEKYSHIGFSIGLFGRSEGMNEEGLCITFSACGTPVGSLSWLRKPAVTGLQFWTVVRSVLDNCKTVEEAVDLIQSMPIVSNSNFLLTEPSGKSALIQVFDGVKDIIFDNNQDARYTLFATNHEVIKSSSRYGSPKVYNSKHRYNTLKNYMFQHDFIDIEEFKTFFHGKYPNGLSVHYYEQFFGTLRSVIFNLTDRSLEFCYGSPCYNNKVKLRFGDDLPFSEINVNIESELSDRDFWKLI
ncbi:C45 family autoproteolytic acyltransferase/hydolase [Senegalia massiliensis]|uniref:C45 family autoproteolytic acyltransferase/hydolase n=1 Tax=Senegalia massiliensis TaxID=1720316 RepID=UPI00102FF2CA|nr:C45 family peptidase [Senegalia massiliensis]